ncbi:MAG: TonB-dependent receptor [Candidatus Marinimicrobia bacterium]|nr:TonB-dependent receptor [Candidatus Neomarinimicrobiota bacterium]
MDIKHYPQISLAIVLTAIVMLLIVTAASAQGQEVKYTVTVIDEETGEPLLGTNIVVKGTNRGTTTASNGRFSIDASEGEVLVVSYLGYETQEVAVSPGLSTIRLRMTALELESLVVVGSRGKPRTNLERPVPVDAIRAREIRDTGHMDLGQALHYVAPSFSAVKFGINDLAPLVDPATLRGLGQDQTLILVNGKRRHKFAFFNLNEGHGHGLVGNDINAIPAAAISRVEVLRDGAAAQYGSDAIAGVINMQLKNASSGGSFRVYTGTGYSNPDEPTTYSEDKSIKDGETVSVDLNFGLPYGNDGFINTTVHIQRTEAYDRSGTYTHSGGFYTGDEVEDARLRALNGIDLDRAVLGSAKNTNAAFFINAGNPIDENWNFYTFGGLTFKRVIGGIFTRAAARKDRRVLEIFPDGFNPETPTNLTDLQFVSGVKGNLADDLSLDISGGYGSNRVDFFNRNTVNPSMGPDSPTSFFTGALFAGQATFNADLVKTIDNMTIAVGSELRFESFEQIAGQKESWLIGDSVNAEGGKDVGSTGREGYTPNTAGTWDRNNIGYYAEVESDLTERLLVGGAVRFEDYSDFGSDQSYKVAGRFKLSDALSIRSSVNRSFRAPALAQLHYSNFINIAFDPEGGSVVTPFLPVGSDLVKRNFGIDHLVPEKSFALAVGITSKMGENLALTLDVYQIDIDDRIAVSGGIDISTFPELVELGYDEVNIFTNVIDTRTQGVDFIATYGKRFDENRKLKLTLAANVNELEILETRSPDIVAAKGIDVFDARAAGYLKQSTPRQKYIFSGNYEMGKLGYMFRGTFFGEVHDARGGPGRTDFIMTSKIVNDLSISYTFSHQLSITAGANNILDVYPDLLPSPNVRGEVVYSRRANQFGTQGRFFHLSLNHSWR